MHHQTIDQKIHFVTGKGGVGKSFLAATLAHHFSQKSEMNPNQPVLLAELGEHSFYEHYFDLNSINYKPQSLKNQQLNFDMALWSGSDCLREYAHYLLKIESLANLFFDNPISKALINVAPGLQELAILGKATSSQRKHGPNLPYSHIVFDAYSTGHFLNLFRAPQALAQTIHFGPMGEQSRDINQWIRTPDFCHIHLVTLAEEMPTTETVEFYLALKNEFNLTATVYLNKICSVQNEELGLYPQNLQEYFTSLIAEQNRSRQLLSQNQIPFVEIPFLPVFNNFLLIGEASLRLKNKIARTQ